MGAAPWGQGWAEAGPGHWPAGWSLGLWGRGQLQAGLPHSRAIVPGTGASLGQGLAWLLPPHSTRSSPTVPTGWGRPCGAAGADPPGNRCVLRAWRQTWWKLGFLRFLFHSTAIIFPLISKRSYLKIS